MEKETNKTKNLLLKNGLKPTYQRIVIYDFLDQNRIHPTVDTIYSMVHKELPTISKTTIYNTLNLFLDKNLILGLTITGLEMHFDINTKPHHHFYCVTCGKVYDLEIHCSHSNNKSNIIDGNLIREIHGYFKGICKNCKR